MAYGSHRHHGQQAVSARRVKHLLSSGGCTGPKKRSGGTVGSGGGKAEKQAEQALNRMHSEKSMHEAYKRGGHVARGNDSAEQMAPSSAEASDTYVEGVRNSHRIPKKRGGATGRPPVVNVDTGRHIHIHLPHPGAGPMPGAGMPPGIAAAPPGVMAGPGPAMAGPAQGLPQGLPPGVAAPGIPVRAQGGRTLAGAASGVSRLEAAEMMKRREH
jgi:hypothetical protein